MASNAKNLAEMLNTDVTVTATDIADGAVTPEKIADTVNLGRRNIVINGAFQVAQRGTSISIPVSSITYTLDRFFGRPNASTAGSVGQATDAPEGFEYSARVRRSSGQTGTLTRFETPFETRDIIKLRGQKVTISFYAKAGSGYTPSSSALSVLLWEGDGTERNRAITSFDNENLLVNSPKVLTTSWQRFTHTTSANIASDTTQLALQFQAAWSGTAPSGDEYYITGIQLEAGDTATPFEHRSFNEELILCKRYYQKSYEYGDAPGSSDSAGMYLAQRFNTSDRYYPLGPQFPEELRTVPTVTIYDRDGVTNSINQYNAASNKESIVSINGNDSKTILRYLDNNTGSGTDYVQEFHWVSEAEL